MKRILQLSFAFVGLSLFIACKTEINQVQETVIDDVIYEVNDQTLYQSNVEKTKQKSSEQYLSILYANLYQTSIPQDALAELTELRLATGDKLLLDELILNNYINTGGAIIPSDQEMRADPDLFIEQTYLRFFLRKPTPYELFELKEAIEEDPALSPEMIYQAFALSNEYKFY